MNISSGDLLTWLIVGWLAGVATVPAEEQAEEAKPAVADLIPAQALLVRPGSDKSEFQMFRQAVGGTVEGTPSFTVRSDKELGEVSVFIRSSREFPRFHFVPMRDKSIRVFRNDGGRRRQYPSYVIEPEAGQAGSFSVFQAKATVIQRFRSARIEINNEKKLTRIFGTLQGDTPRHRASREIPHADLKHARGFRVKGLDLKTLTGVVGAIDVLTN